ncbi:MAG: hypothetical protein D9C04_03830 [Nitrosopumilus sp. B06]|nr:MAG: hypothetical protein D9C04_03830 [Nitrosopumilus sp. B06]
MQGIGRSKGATIKRNQRRGKEAEKAFENESKFLGRKITRSGRGHDYIEKKKDPFTGKVTRIRHEIKSGDGKLSRKQKRSSAQNGHNYRVHHYGDGILAMTKVSETRGKTRKKSAFGDLFGDSKPIRKRSSKKPTRTKSSSILDNVFPNPSKTTKKSSKKSTTRKKSSSWFDPLDKPKKSSSKRSSSRKKSSSWFD